MPGPPYSLPSLADLVTPSTQEELLALQLTTQSELGLPVTAWQAVQLFPALNFTNSQIASSYSQTAAYIAQGGYASYASLMVDSNGNPVQTWTQLIAYDLYNILQIPATLASGNVPLLNTSPTSYPFNPTNPLHFQQTNSQGVFTYTSVGTGNVFGSSLTNIPVTADVPGSASTAGTGVVLQLTTPLGGVAVQPLVNSIVGSNAETNQAMIVRGQNKLGTLSVSLLSSNVQGTTNSAGPSQAYSYLATNLPQGTPASSAPWGPPWAVSSPITRCSVVFGEGVTNVYVANADGAPSSQDVSVVNSAIQALVTPGSVTANVMAATTQTQALVATLYITSSAGLTQTLAITNAEDALALYEAGLPIGGKTGASPNIMPWSELITTLTNANANTQEVDLTVPAANVPVAPSAIVAITPTLSVVFV